MATDEVEEVEEPPTNPPGDEPGVVIAGVGRRVGAGVVDSVAITVATYVVFLLADAQAVPALGWVAFVIAEFVLVVAPMAMTGRPLGAVIARTMVIRSVDHQAPGWMTSILRWLAAHVPSLVAGAAISIGVPNSVAAGLTVLQLVALIAIYGAMLFSADTQGLHDRVAETIVVLRHGEADTWLIRQRRSLVLDPRQIAVEARKHELIALGVDELLLLVPTTGYDSRPADLITSHADFRLFVTISRDQPSRTNDVLFAVSAESDNRFLHEVFIDAFALRDGSRIEELTDDEWGSVT